jgi:hypothetical protein
MLTLLIILMPTITGFGYSLSFPRQLKERYHHEMHQITR